MILYQDAQGTEAWLAARRGVITASKFKVCRERLKSGAMSKACISYAQDVARERCGGAVLPTFINAAMRTGIEQESKARMAYELATDSMVMEAGFICTDDRKFGVSVDGRIESDGLWECKTMVSSDTLFTAVVDGDISEYVDQCNGAMWLLCAKWIDLHLWVYDMPHLSQIIRIERDDDVIEALESDLIAFERLVTEYETKLLAKAGAVPVAELPPWDAAKPATSSTALPADIFA